MRLPDWRYEQIKEIVSTLLSKRIRSIPVDVFLLAKSLNINLVPYSKLREYEIMQLRRISAVAIKDGFCVYGTKNGEDVYFIYYDDRQNKRRIRFTILHEIAHVVLGHLEQSDLAEAEANFFAKYALAPPVLINILQPNDYIDISKVFDISHICAQNSFQYYLQWKKMQQIKNYSYKPYEWKLLYFFGENIRSQKKIVGVF